MKNNSKGLITILLIPVFVILITIIVDTFISYLEVNRFKKDTEAIITEVLSNDNIYYSDYYNEVKKLYDLKKYNTDMLVVDANEYEINVENEYNYFGFLSSFNKTNGVTSDIDFLGYKFKINKKSKYIVRVSAKYNDGKIEFVYTK